MGHCLHYHLYHHTPYVEGAAGCGKGYVAQLVIIPLFVVFTAIVRRPTAHGPNTMNQNHYRRLIWHRRDVSPTQVSRSALILNLGQAHSPIRAPWLSGQVASHLVRTPSMATLLAGPKRGYFVILQHTPFYDSTAYYS
jgi:hypothetical protein